MTVKDALIIEALLCAADLCTPGRRTKYVNCLGEYDTWSSAVGDASNAVLGDSSLFKEPVIRIMQLSTIDSPEEKRYALLEAAARIYETRGVLR